MEVIVTGRQMEVTPALREYIQDKVKRIEKYMPKTEQIVFTLKVEKHRHHAEVLTKVNGTPLQAEGETDTMYSAIEAVLEKIERQLKKSKEKLGRHRVKSEGDRRHLIEAGGGPQAMEVSKVKEVTHVSITPMTVDEAALQIDQRHEKFFLFGNKENQQVNLLYRREDGTLGLVTPPPSS